MSVPITTAITTSATTAAVTAATVATVVSANQSDSVVPPSRPAYRLTFARLIRSEFYKLTSLKSTWWLLAINLVLFPGAAAITAAVTRSAPDIYPAAQVNLLTGLLGLLQIQVILVAIMGILSYTGEVSSNTIQGSYAADPGRSGLFFGKAIAIFCLTAVSSLVGTLLGWALGEAMMSGLKVEPLDSALRVRLPLTTIVGTALVMGLVAVLGVGLGALLRSTIAAVLAFLGMVLLLPLILSILEGTSRPAWAFTAMNLLPETALEHFLQAGAADAVSGASSAVPAFGQAWVPAWWASGLIFLAWTLVIVLVGWLVSRRRDLK